MRYLEAGQLHVSDSAAVAWLDTGTPELLLQAANFVEALELRQGLKIACRGDRAYKRFISVEQFCRLADAERNTWRISAQPAPPPDGPLAQP